MIIPTTLQGEEKLLYRRVEELEELALTRQKPQFSSFLNPREQEIAQAACRKQGVFFGGYPEAQRQVLGIFPAGAEEHEDLFPIQVVKILHQKGKPLNHRWVLGSLIGLGIERTMIGDILPLEDYCILLCKTTVAPVIIEELRRVGSIGVRCQEGILQDVVYEQHFEIVTGTIASLRLDSLVALLTRSSREKSNHLFSTQQVLLNYAVAEKGTRSFGERDIITIRGYGKFIVDVIGLPTRKGRIPIECRKYQ